MNKLLNILGWLFLTPLFVCAGWAVWWCAGIYLNTIWLMYTERQYGDLISVAVIPGLIICTCIGVWILTGVQEETSGGDIF